VTGATIVNAACQQEGGGLLAAGLRAGAHGRILLAACLCCPLEILCGSCTHQRARAKGFLFSGQGIPLERVETVNLRDEVLNQSSLGQDAALSLARRLLAAGIARALAGSTAAADRESAASRTGPAELPSAIVQTSESDRPAPLPLPGSAVTAAWISPVLCRGCGTCARSCPQEAIALHPRSSGIPLARVTPASCTLCGRCLAVCPVGAPDVPFASHAQLRQTLAAAFAGEYP
jgi:ferredoxin